MSNGYLLAAGADVAAAREIADGFGLEVIDASAIEDQEAVVAALASAANVGVVLSNAAAADAGFVALVQRLSQSLLRAQLILVEDTASAAFGAPSLWPAMSLDEARARSSELVRRRQASEDAAPAPAEEPAPQEQPATQEEPPLTQHAEPETPAPEPAPQNETPAPEDTLVGSAPDLSDDGATGAGGADDSRTETLAPPTEAPEPVEEEAPVAAAPEPPARERAITLPPPEPEPAPEPAPPPQSVAPAPLPPAAEPPPVQSATPPEAPKPQAPARRDESFGGAVDMHSSTASRAPSARLGETAPADATAFAPKKLRRSTPELVRIVVHQPKDLQAVIKAARKIDPRTEPAPQGMPIGNIALGATIGVALEVRGATCDGTLQRRTWNGDPIDFSFSVEADTGVKQAVLLARVFVDDAQIGVLAFTRNISGPSKKPASDGDRVRLKRHKRVFLSYSSKDRETVSQIASAYQAAGVEHFWDRSSLKSGEEWHPRLRREIDRADLFHLCWSKAASTSEWVEKETEHALTRRRKNSGKPDITVQMLDGPPWAPHPPQLDGINFDDFVRAAIVGYARGDGSS